MKTLTNAVKVSYITKDIYSYMLDPAVVEPIGKFSFTVVR